MIQYAQVTVKVPKETYALEQGLVAFVGACKQALADGFQVGQDLPVIISAALADLLPAVAGVGALPEEAKGDLPAMINVGGLLVGDLAKVFMKPAGA